MFQLYIYWDIGKYSAGNAMISDKTHGRAIARGGLILKYLHRLSVTIKEVEIGSPRVCGINK